MNETKLPEGRAVPTPRDAFQPSLRARAPNTEGRLIGGGSGGQGCGSRDLSQNLGC